MTQETILEGVAASNFKGLRDVEFDFRRKGHLIIFGGDEGAGKSTAMEIIKVTLYGTKNCPSQPIRKGEKEAWTETRFNDLVARRVFTVKGTRLEVKAKRDLPPQEWLTKLFGIDKAKALAVDPLGLFDLSSRQLIDKLQKAVGLDFTELDEKRQALYDQRHDLNQETRNLSERIEAIKPQPDAPDKPIVIGELLEERTRREKINKGNRTAKQALETLREQASHNAITVGNLKIAITELEEEMSARRRVLETQNKEQDRLITNGKEAAAKVEKCVDADLQEIDQQLASAEEQNAKLRMKQDREQLSSALKAGLEEANKLSDQITNIDSDKASQIAGAEFSVEGLTFNEDRVLYNDIDIRQASRNEKLRIGVALILALNPKAPAIVIDEGSGLSKESLDVLAELGDKYKKYILVGRTSKGSEVTFLMKDGAVEGIEEATTELGSQIDK